MENISGKNNSIQIAIDGPAGAGKSSVAKALSQKLGILYLNTGAMYRAFAFHVYDSGYDRNVTDADINKLFDSFSLSFDKENIILNGKDITDIIRTAEIDKKVSEFAPIPLVRKKMVKLQQKIAEGSDIVMEGRDICAVVMPHAPYKFYLDASVDCRAKRRYAQNIEKGISVTLEEIKQDIIRRDEVDKSREADPLKIACDAVVIDSTYLTLNEVVERIAQCVKDGTK